MAMTNRTNIKHDGLIMSTLDDLVPQDHLVRTLEATIDWKFIYPLVKSREFDSYLHFFTNQIAQNVDYINAFEFFCCQIRKNNCTNMG